MVLEKNFARIFPNLVKNVENVENTCFFDPKSTFVINMNQKHPKNYTMHKNAIIHPLCVYTHCI